MTAATTAAQDLPTVPRAEHNERIARGEKAAGPYAYVTMGMDGLTYLWDARDENDQQVEFGRASGPTMARIAAKRLGATFIVTEF